MIGCSVKADLLEARQLKKLGHEMIIELLTILGKAPPGLWNPVINFGARGIAFPRLLGYIFYHLGSQCLVLNQSAASAVGACHFQQTHSVHERARQPTQR